MADTLLQLVQYAAGAVGLPAPTSVIGSTVAQTQQYLQLVNEAGRMLAREYDWQALQIEYRFNTQFVTTTGNTVNGSPIVTGIPSTVGLSNLWQPTGVGINQDTYIDTVDSATQVTMSQPATATGLGVQIIFCQTKYLLPAPWDRSVDNTQWDKSKHWQMLGPETQQQVAWLKSGFISTGPRIRYYFMDQYLQIWPPVTTNEYLGLNYIGKNWVCATGVLQPSKTLFTADTDTSVFPDILMQLLLKLKLFEIKGFDTTAMYRDYTDQLSIAKANDAGSPMLSMSPSPVDILVGWQNIPDSGYGT